MREGLLCLVIVVCACALGMWLEKHNALPRTFSMLAFLVVIALIIAQVINFLFFGGRGK